MTDGGPGELSEQEAQREEKRERYRELLEELRTIIPGVQVLFAFLLTVPFAQRFTEVDGLGQAVFAAAIVGVALATVVLLTPAAYHRIANRQDRAERLQISVRMTVVGLALLGLSIAAVVFVVLRFLYDSTLLGIACGGAALLAVAVSWYGLPLLRRRHDRT